MCGICGYISKRRIGEETLRAMNDTLAHRGPDDAGVEIYPWREGFHVGFAHRRLSIQDLSPAGHQPMHTADFRLSIVFNGEIYNFLRLKEELADFPFVSTCDTEVILAAYLRWGEAFVSHIHGMFALALFDRQEDVVYFARDRIGKKPLYYYRNGEELIFGSELKPILASPGFSGRIRREVLPRFLFQQYLHAPDTILEDVFQLPPGCVMRLRPGMEPEIHRYWSVAERYAQLAAAPVTDYAEAREGLKCRLIQAVSDRMIADVPLGTFLSGGYDSSLVTAVAQSLSDKPVQTFSIGFEEAAYDESPYADAVADHLGTKHTKHIISEREMLDLVEQIPTYYDEPYADSSQIPTMLVCALARKDVTVALSGDGGDEFFCGYGIYENVAQAQRLDGLGRIAHLVGRLPVPGGQLRDHYPFRVGVIADNRDPRMQTQISSGGYLRTAAAFVGDIDSLPIRYPLEPEYGVSDWQVRRMLLDMDTYLPDDILVKMDRASMSVALEVRCPILDTEVMEYSFRIPQRFKYDHGDKKHILKDIAYDYIPKELLDRPKKGFGVPLDKWLRGPLRQALTDYSDESFLRRQGVFDAAFVTPFIRRFLEQGDAGPATGANYSKLAWSFFVFERWAERYREVIR